MDMHGLDLAMLKPLSDMNKGQSRKYIPLRELNYFICMIIFIFTFR